MRVRLSKRVERTVNELGDHADFSLSTRDPFWLRRSLERW